MTLSQSQTIQGEVLGYKVKVDCSVIGALLVVFECLNEGTGGKAHLYLGSGWWDGERKSQGGLSVRQRRGP